MCAGPPLSNHYKSFHPGHHSLRKTYTCVRVIDSSKAMVESFTPQTVTPTSEPGLPPSVASQPCQPPPAPFTSLSHHMPPPPHPTPFADHWRPVSQTAASVTTAASSSRRPKYKVTSTFAYCVILVYLKLMYLTSFVCACCQTTIPAGLPTPTCTRFRASDGRCYYVVQQGLPWSTPKCAYHTLQFETHPTQFYLKIHGSYVPANAVPDSFLPYVAHLNLRDPTPVVLKVPELPTKLDIRIPLPADIFADWKPIIDFTEGGITAVFQQKSYTTLSKQAKVSSFCSQLTVGNMSLLNGDQQPMPDSHRASQDVSPTLNPSILGQVSTPSLYHCCYSLSTIFFSLSVSLSL